MAAWFRTHLFPACCPASACDTLTFQVDLWSARGRVPYDMMEVSSRQKDIQYSSRTRAVTDQVLRMQKMRQALQKTIEKLPEAAKQDPEVRAIADMARHRSYNIIHLIYQSKIYEGHSRDYEFGLSAMRAHWQSGLDDIRRTLADPQPSGPPVAGARNRHARRASRRLTCIFSGIERSSHVEGQGRHRDRIDQRHRTRDRQGAGEGRRRIVLNGFGDASEIEAIRNGIERDHDVRVVYDGADMSKAEAVRGLISATIETFGRLDILVNNAGIQFTAPVEEFPADKWDAILDINLSAAFHGIAAAVAQMKKQRWGRIVNIASAHGLVASTHKAAYVAAKHGLVGPHQGGRPRDRRQRRYL